MTALPRADAGDGWATGLVARWLDEFERGLATGPAAAAELFAEDAHWRDIVAFTWRIGQVHGRAAIQKQLAATLGRTAPRRWRIAGGRPAPRRAVVFGQQVVEAFVDFDTQAGRGTAVVRLVPQVAVPGDTAAGWHAWLLLTTIQELHPSSAPTPEAAKPDDGEVSMADPVGRAARYGYSPATPTQSWAEHRQQRRAYADREPDVLIVGAGHSGQMLGARLGQLGIDTLIVDRLPKIGDVWRNRYHSLALHNPTAASDFPYLPFPPTFPRYMSKDRLANWLEFYADAMDLNVWTSTEIRSATYRPGEQRWTVTVQTTDGSRRVLQPRHLVMAAGAFGTVPHIPPMPGLDTFEGRVLHTAEFQTGADFAGQRVLIIGVGTSAHDTALDIHQHGGHPAMLQRNPIAVVGLETKEQFSTADIPPGASTGDIDMIAAANLIFPLARDAVREAAELSYQHDLPLIKRLQEAGMQVNLGEDGTGWQMKAWRTGAGYYINVGASEAVASGGIKIIQQDDTTGFMPEGLALRSGDVLSFDAVILATGFQNLEVVIADVFGQELAERLGPIYRLDDYGTGEWTNSWIPTAQEGLWFMVGALALTRPNSLYLALQLKARLSGLAPADG